MIKRATIGLPRERKAEEYRVALTPAAVRELVRGGHRVLVERGAGIGSGISDEAYTAVGAKVVNKAASVWEAADLVCKVKEPQPDEYKFLRAELILFAYLHLATYGLLARALAESGVTALAYETVQLPDGSLPLLRPMSEIAGRLAPQVGARFLERFSGGRGILLSGVPGVPPASVVVLGAGIVGANAARIAEGMGADVTVLDVDVTRLRRVETDLRDHVRTQFAEDTAVAQLVMGADLVIGGVLRPGARTPHLVTSDMVRSMRVGSVLVDVSIDQGGCFETSHETRHSDPAYELHGILHYAVGNMPGAVPRTATYALANAIVPYVLALASSPIDEAMRTLPALERAVNVRQGAFVHPAVKASVARPTAL